MIKAILIDIDNTLLDFNESAKEAIRLAFEQFNLPFTDQTFSTFKRINDGLWLRIEKGELDRPGLHKIRFNLVFNELGIDFDGPTFEKQFLANLFHVACPVDGAKEILTYLSSKYPVYAASNAIYDQQINRLTKTGMIDCFKGLFISEKIGFQKPTKEFFDVCFNALGGVKPSEVAMIGDSLTADINGGKDYGMVTCWYNHDGSDKQSEKADYKIDSLYQIKNIF